MKMGENDDISVNDDSGVATWIRSVPTRAAANADIAGAPMYGPPPMTKSLPFCPLWESFPDLGYLIISPGPTRSYASLGMPMSAMMIVPQFDSSIPSLMSWNVTVISGTTAQFVPRPEGTSHDMIILPD